MSEAQIIDELKERIRAFEGKEIWLPKFCIRLNREGVSDYFVHQQDLIAAIESQGYKVKS